MNKKIVLFGVLLSLFFSAVVVAQTSGQLVSFVKTKPKEEAAAELQGSFEKYFFGSPNDQANMTGALKSYYNRYGESPFVMTKKQPSDLQNQLDRAREELDRARTQLAETQGYLDTARRDAQQLAAAQARIRDLDMQLKARQDELALLGKAPTADEFRKEIEQLRKEGATRDAALTKAQQDLAKAQQEALELPKLQKRIKELEDQLTAMQRKLDSMMQAPEQLAEAVARINKLDRENEKLKGALEDAQQQLKDIRAENERLRQVIKDDEARLKAAEAAEKTIAMLDKQLKERDADLLRMTGDLDTQTEEVAKLEEENRRLKTENATLGKGGAEVQKLRDENKDLKDKLQKADKEIKALNKLQDQDIKQFEKMEQEAAALKKERDQLRDEKSKLYEQFTLNLGEAGPDIPALLERLQKESEKKANEIAQIEIGRIRQHKAKEQKEHTELQEQYVKLMDERDTLKGKNDRCQGDLKTLQTSLQESRRATTEQGEASQSQNTELVEKGKQITRLEGRIRGLEKEKADLQERYEAAHLMLDESEQHLLDEKIKSRK